MEAKVKLLELKIEFVIYCGIPWKMVRIQLLEVGYAIQLQIISFISMVSIRLLNLFQTWNNSKVS
jgi:hypothetical protein